MNEEGPSQVSPASAKSSRRAQIWILAIAVVCSPWPTGLYYGLSGRVVYFLNWSSLGHAIDTTSLRSILFAVLTTVSCIAMCVILLFIPRFWKTVPIILAVLAINVTGVFSLVKARAHFDRERFEAATVRAQPIVDALEAYKRDTGHYPPTLAQLIPTYLPKIPKVDNVTDNPFCYGVRRAGTRDSGYSLLMGASFYPYTNLHYTQNPPDDEVKAGDGGVLVEEINSWLMVTIDS